MPTITAAHIFQELPDWTVVNGRLELSVLAKDFAGAIAFVSRFADIAEQQDHHPDFDIRYNTIRMRVVSHDVGGLTNRDLRFAAAVDELIDELALKRQPKKITRTQLVFASADVESIKPFWKAVFDFKEEATDGADLLVDKSDVLPPLRFYQLTHAPASAVNGSDGFNGMGNVHLEMFVPADQAESRVQAALDAGGKLLSTAEPSEWELADSDGNRVFLRTDR